MSEQLTKRLRGYPEIEECEDAAARIEELEAALAFYRDGWLPYQPNKKLPGLAWKPKEALLDDCGDLARTTLARKQP